MTKNSDPGRTSDEDRNADEVRADNPKKSMDHLKALAKKVLKVPKQMRDQLREGSGVT